MADDKRDFRVRDYDELTREDVADIIGGVGRFIGLPRSAIQVGKDRALALDDEALAEIRRMGRALFARAYASVFLDVLTSVAAEILSRSSPPSGDN